MFVLDTNVVSELIRPAPNPAVVAWVGGRPAASLFFTAIGEAEMRFGVAIMPPGARRDALAAQIDGMVREDFARRVLPFDSLAARAYAKFAAARRRAGRPVSLADGQIAAIAASRGGQVVTRNVRDFEGIGIAVVNPWEGG
jgi:predicted nucleic acid-binding protein